MLEICYVNKLYQKTSKYRLIPVYYNNYRDKQVKLNKFYKLGLPYCHQGNIFENKKLYYNCNYKIASDYDFYLRHNYKNKLNFQK